MRTRRVLLAALVALLVAGCGGGPRGDVAATVDDAEIEVGTVEVLVASQLAGQGSAQGRPSPDDYATASQLQRDVLSQLVQDVIITRGAEELGVEVPDEAVEEQWQAVVEQFGGEEELLAEIERRGVTEEQVRDQLAGLVRRERLTEYFAQNVDVEDDEIAQAYEEQRDTRFRTARVSHILVEEEAEAQRILDDLRAGEDFSELAARYSTDEFSAARGGDLGENPRGSFVEAFDEAVWSAEAGELVGPVQTEFGYHIIRVEEFVETPLADVEGELRLELGELRAQEGLAEWFQEQVQLAEVEVNPRFGEWDPEAGAIVSSDPLQRGPLEEGAPGPGGEITDGQGTQGDGSQSGGGQDAGGDGAAEGGEVPEQDSEADGAAGEVGPDGDSG